MQTDYLQPDFYRFSDDSLKLVEFVIHDYVPQMSVELLDLCAGSGVVGIEYALKHSQVTRIDFCEIQPEFIPYLTQNQKHFLPGVETNIHQLNYAELKLPNQYDLILSNPPYFFQGKGLLSPNKMKNRCRFFLDSNLSEFLLCLVRHLRPSGSAYFLGRTGDTTFKSEFSVAQGVLPVGYRLEEKLALASCSIFKLSYV